MLHVTFAEPTTMLTDYALAVLCGFCARLLWRNGLSSGQAGRCYWAAGLGCLGFAALAGGTVHGLSGHLTHEILGHLWKSTIYAVGLASFFLFAGTVRASLASAARRIIMLIPVIQLIVYSLWMATRDDFRFVLYNYGFTITVILALQLYAVVARGERSAGWLVGGVVITLIAAVIQDAGISLHRHFNHNDLYHVVQMAGIYGFYRGASVLYDR